jgi:hypothetical protein
MLDHACGSSRAEKVERDLRLLRAGVEAEPDNARYMFYLAQTLRDAGQHQEALAWYLKRAAAGGWEEEAWYSEYQAAACRLELGDHDGFVAAALAAWDRRPWRLEPLALLTGHYRGQGKNHLCAELAAMGLRAPFPEQDRLFISADVYAWRFAFDLSISGYYARDPVLRQQAARCCHWLALDREVPEWVRAQARSNSQHYAQQAESWLGMQRVQLDTALMEPRWSCFNPSLWIADGKASILVCQSNYRLVEGHYAIDDAEQVVRSKMALLDLDADWRPANARWLGDGPTPAAAGVPRQPGPVRGYEDCRLFHWHDAWWATAVVRDTTPEAKAEIMLLQLADDGVVRNEQVLRGPWSEVNQKNWMPLVRGNDLLFVCSLDPTVVLRFDPDAQAAVPHCRSEPGIAVGHLRGGSQCIALDEGWLGVCHEVVERAGGARVYLHRFFLLDEELRLAALTDPFKLAPADIEFCAGLALLPDGHTLALSYGIQDAEAWLGLVELRAVTRRLQRLA